MMGKRGLLAIGLAASMVGVASGAPYPSADTPAPANLGVARVVSGNEPITVTVALQLRNTAQAQALLESTYTRGSPNFHHFITAQEFSERFGPSDAAVAQVTRTLQGAGLQVERTSTTLLKVTGSTSAVEAAFAVSMHTFEVPASLAGPGYRYRAPLSTPQVSPALAPSIQAVVGLDTRPRLRPHAQHVDASQTPKVTLSASAPNTPNAPGLWTVADFAQYYDVQPLYKAGLQGSHRTIGIVTFAGFTPSDAFSYWQSLALPVAANRLSVVNVDGGAGAPSDFTGSFETTLDVEQAGGIAPAANMIVYEAPNTEQGVIDAFAAAIESNVSDTISTSWGRWEYVDDTSTVTDPVTHQDANALKALNDLFIQAALQGQTLYASSGNFGAYDANGTFPAAFNTKTVSVDAPASLPFITAAGGTTLPGKLSFPALNSQTFTVNIPSEQAWSLSYMTPLCTQRQQDPVTCGIFPQGGGGGVSVFTPRPFYQWFIPGIANSAPGQALSNESTTPAQLIFQLPANFPGRNVPDISLNADPNTGYALWYTSDFTGFQIVPNYGGTSFAAPQLSGVTALFDQGLGHRIGLLNPQLYGLVLFDLAYTGHNAPLRDITAGDNWFYKGARGYDQATGIGVPDVANLYQTLRWW